MAIFGAIATEKAVQIEDFTRIDSSKAIVSKGSSPITVVNIKSESTAAAVDVFVVDESDDWFLDWSYENFEADIVVGVNSTLPFKYADTLYSANLNAGSYDLPALATQVESALNTAVGSAVLSFTYDQDINKFTLSSTGSNWTVIPTEDNLWNMLGFIKTFRDPLQNRGTVIGEFVRWVPKVSSVEVGDGVTTSVRYKQIEMYSVDGDRLFSKDDDLLGVEPEIMCFLKTGRSTFLDKHREAQRYIIAKLDEQGLVNVYGDPFTAFDIRDKAEVVEWSRYLALHFIYKGLNNTTDDIFKDKAKDYWNVSLKHGDKARAVLRIDVNKDEIVDVHEQISISSSTIIRM